MKHNRQIEEIKLFKLGINLDLIKTIAKHEKWP